MTHPVAVVSPRVLLVDDEGAHLQLRAYAMKRCGYSVVTAGNAVEALSLMEKESIAADVAVIDYHVLVMNGCALADRLRAMRPEIKIILNSGAIDVPK